MTALEPASIIVPLAVTLRTADREDLPKLEWYGQYIHFRNLFRRAFREQQLGRRLILVADCNHFPIGYLFIQFAPADEGSLKRAYLYSFRVMEMFRGQGIGTRLLQYAEVVIRQRDHNWALISVAKNNPAAHRLYERMGYRVYAEDEGRWHYVDHRGNLRYVHEPCWMLQKQIVTG
ncbi:MAG: GNAT family N-acetyltransferase [Chloroflexi bacterium]|nr:GNAT family N-acetyltransferase [Chloroflexota bacterium]